MMRRQFVLPWRTRTRLAADVEGEIAFHVLSRVDDLVARGMSAEDATALARREFGDLEDARRYMLSMDRETETRQRRREHVRDLLQDARYALRRMRIAPMFTVTAVATLALGIGANTAVFSVVEAALLRPLPYPTADRIVEALTLSPRGAFVASPSDFADWRSQTSSFAGMSAVLAYARTLTGLGEPQSVDAARVTHGFFQIFGAQPALGRGFMPDEERPGNTNFVILSHAFWQQQMGARPEAVGQTLQLDGKSFVVVGVMPDGFAFPARTRLWTPLAFRPEDLATQRGAHYLEVVALLKAGVDLRTAEADLQAVAARLAAAYPNTNKDYSATLRTLRDHLVGSTSRRALLVLLGAVALVALIACANVANLVLARGTARAREMAVRLALGASPRDLLYMALTESVLLALIGGAVGLLLARGLAGVLDSLRPDALRQIGELHVSLAAGAFTFALSLLAGVLFGMAPGLQAARRHSLQPALQSGGRANAGGRESDRMRSMLVAAEIALAVLLLSGAGLLIKSFARLQHVDAGFDTANLLVLGLSLPEVRYPGSEQTHRALADILARAAALPGVTAAGAISILPLDGNRFSISTRSLDGWHIPETEQPSAQIRVVTPGTLRALRIRLLSGRDFGAEDRAGALRVALVNEAAARLLWKDVDPLGHSLEIGTRFGSDTAHAGGVVVGVVADVHDAALGAAPSPTIYFPHAQAAASDMYVVARAPEGVSPYDLAGPVRAQIREVDALLPVEPTTMEHIAAASVAQPRFATLLMSAFAALAVVLASIGVFGVMAYVVGQRTREIGIRIALGASQRRVVSETLGRAAVPLLVGIGLGLAATFFAMHLMGSLLYDVSPNDPLVLVSVVAGLAGVALLAAYLPARRASAVDPALALRGE